MSDIQGYCDPAFTRIRNLLQEKLGTGEEVGASLCVNIDGKTVLDIWAGHADAAKTRPWEKDTLVAVWSCSKIITSLAAVILIDRGLLDPEERVSKYWPEFAANGKEDTRVWHILSHSSGVPQWDKPITVDSMYDTEKATEMLAGQAPWFKAGEACAYQLVNHGHLVGELVRRVSGKPLKQFIADEIAGPLGADFTLGLPEGDWERAAELIPPPPVDLPGLDLQSVAGRTFTNITVKPEETQSPGFRKTEAGGVNGFGNARALARIGSVVSLNGIVDGKQYLETGTVDQMLRERICGVNLVLFQKLRFGLGVALPLPESIGFIPMGNIGFWFGWGGSFLLMDVDRRMTIAYTMNKMAPGLLGSESAEAFIKRIYEIVSEKEFSAVLQ